MTIKINNFKWKIVFKKIEEEPLGVTTMIPPIIYIDDRLDLQTARATIIHELIHATLWSLGIYKTQDSDKYLSLSEEQICEFCAMNLDNILKNTEIIFKKYKEKCL